MASRLTKAAVKRRRLMRKHIEAKFVDAGLVPYEWKSQPGEWYEWHDHPFHDVIYCVLGSVVFHTRDGDYMLEPGDRFEMDPHTEHAATVGPLGVVCLEAKVV